MAGLLAGGIAASLSKYLAPAIGILGVMAIGAAGDEMYERVAPWGVYPSRDHWHQVAETNAANWRTMKTWGEGWQAADLRAETQRLADAQKAAADLQLAEAAQTQASSDAFDQGVAFGRASTSKTCGASNATIPVGGGDVVPGAKSGGVRWVGPDFAADWSRAAYVPDASVPSQP